MVGLAKSLRRDERNPRRSGDRIQRVGRDGGGGESEGPPLHASRWIMRRLDCADPCRHPGKSWLDVPLLRTYRTYARMILHMDVESQLVCTYRTHAYGGEDHNEATEQALDAAEAGGAAALHRDRRSSSCLEQIRHDAAMLDEDTDRGRPVCPARCRRGRSERRQDARRNHQPVRQPGRVPGGNDGAGAERERLDRARRISLSGRFRRMPTPGSTRSSPASRRAVRSTARSRS